MSQKLRFLLVKVGLSARTLGWLMTRWKYALMSVVVATLFVELMYWLFNLGVISEIIVSRHVTLIEKFHVLASSFGSILQTNGVYVLVFILLVAVVQGVTIATFVYILRHQQKIDPNLIGGSSIAGLLALLGLGCPACGTSLITPVVAIFASGSAVAISEKIIQMILPFALAIGIYGLYVIGLKAASVRVSANGFVPKKT